MTGTQIVRILLPRSAQTQTIGRCRSTRRSQVAFLPPAQLLPLTEILLDRGYTEWEVRDILGGNFLRVASQVWR